MSRGLKIATIVIVALGAIAAGIASSFLGTNTIYPGVSVSGIGLGRLTTAQAEEKLKPLADQYAHRSFTIHYNSGLVKADIADMGGQIDLHASSQAAYHVGREGNIINRISDLISVHRHGIDVPAAFSFDKETASAWLKREALKIGNAPLNARLALDGGAIKIVPGRPGIEVDIAKSLSHITDSINSGQDEADLVTVLAQPKIAENDLRGIEGVVASFSTPYKPWQTDRTHNLRKACTAINGTLLKPDEVFSYNKIVGPRKKELGFRDAPIFVKGEVEQGTGGGVCQVSTTVYNAVLLANMKVLRRSHHSMAVTYTKFGRDATVAWPYPDFKFKNTSGAPIYILASVGSRRVNITILGKPMDDRQIEIVTEKDRMIPSSTVEKVDETLAPGTRVVSEKGHTGHKVSVYRVTKVGGEIVSKELISNDYYAPDDRIVTVGPAKL